MQCEPDAKNTVIATEEEAVRRANARQIGLKMRSPSQNWDGATHPMSCIARTGRFLR